MKKLKFARYMVVAFLLFGVGCNDLLKEPSPATSLPGEEVLSTPTGVESLRSSMYSDLRSSAEFTTLYFVGPSAIADLTSNRPGSSRFQGLNQITGSDGGTNGLAPSGTEYAEVYGLILDANLMISGVEDGTIEQAKLDRYRGEAYALRALAMHHLVRILGYEPGQEVDGWDLGIVIRTKPTQDIADVEEAPRNTVSEVYDQILSDLNEAKPLLAGQDDNTYITEAFVDGLMARVNLYAGNWSAANTAAGNAINNTSHQLVTDSAAVADMFDENVDGGHPEALFKVVVDPNTEPIDGSNVNNGLAAYTSTVWVAQLPTNHLIDLYDPNDNRLGWYAPCFNDRAGTTPEHCTDVNDEGWEIQKWGGEKGQQADDIPYMRISEMYLIQAEARMKASGNYQDGLAPLNTLRQARGLNALIAGVDISSTQEMMDEIMDERSRELAAEGHRFFDLKRLGRDIPKPDGTTKIRYDSYRLLDDVGADNISANGALKENPGY